MVKSDYDAVYAKYKAAIDALAEFEAKAVADAKAAAESSATYA